jgi:hypothetical protein
MDILIGEPLSGVAFVQDYVEFLFDGRIVRALTSPSVTLGDTVHEFPNPGSRDAFCSLIGRVVEEITVERDDAITILLSEGASVSIPLSSEHRSGPEAAHFVSGLNRPIQVW